MPAKHSQSNKARKRCKPDLDEVVNDMHNERKIMRLIDQPVDVEETGCAQYYCMPCRKYFADEHALRTHEKAKPHKRQLKMLKDTPYTKKEADAAAGLGDYKPFLAENMIDTNVEVIAKTLKRQEEVRETRKVNAELKRQAQEMADKEEKEDKEKEDKEKEDKAKEDKKES